MSGLGRGVISPIAEMMGLGMRLLAALLVPPRLWRLCERAVLRLGVLEIGCRFPADPLRWIVMPPRDE
jgi:hypothetical protein